MHNLKLRTLRPWSSIWSSSSCMTISAWSTTVTTWSRWTNRPNLPRPTSMSSGTCSPCRACGSSSPSVTIPSHPSNWTSCSCSSGSSWWSYIYASWYTWGISRRYTTFFSWIICCIKSAIHVLTVEVVKVFVESCFTENFIY